VTIYPDAVTIVQSFEAKEKRVARSTHREYIVVG
jgi:hypothetical protein